jgi:hypothetical protein
VPVEIHPSQDPVQHRIIRIAFIISAYQLAAPVIRLVRRLHSPHHGFFIHYDLRSSDAEFARIARELGGLPNVTLLQRHKCYWGDFGHVRASLKAINEIAKQGFKYDYAILLTAQDYPIKSDASIQKCLAAAAGKSFIEATAWPIPNWDKGRGIERIEHFHWHLPFPRWARSLGWPPGRQHIAIPTKRSIPNGLHPYFGSSYWYLHRSCLQVIHEYLPSHPEYESFFQRALIPDECFFQTLLMNSKVASSVITRTLTYVVWRPPSPGILTIEDLPGLQQSDCLMARKFDPAVDGRILDLLDSFNQADR